MTEISDPETARIIDDLSLLVGEQKAEIARLRAALIEVENYLWSPDDVRNIARAALGNSP